MKVKELIKLLGKANPDAVVIMSKDSEGNRFSELCEVVTENYGWDEQNKDVGIAKLTDEHKKAGYKKDNVMDGIPAILLWPIE